MDPTTVGPSQLASLVSLVKEVLDDEPVNNCADDGISCTFCYRHFRHRHPTRGGDGIIHTPDCWLVRAATLLGEQPPLWAANENNWKP